ncbi:MAG: hypothetical protein GYB27_24775, partial [Rhodobacteraceae bacterium]|nr:hypothetical protein [Paracoccaceae bacterium]
MTDTERNEALHRVFEEMLGHSIENPKAPHLPPIDVRPENFHNSKKEFQAERDAVEASIRHANGLIQQIWPWVFDEAIKDSVGERLSDWLDESAFKRNELGDFRIDETELLLLHAAKSSSFAKWHAPIGWSGLIVSASSAS